MRQPSIPKIVSGAFIDDLPAGSLALAATDKGMRQVFFCNRQDFDDFIAASAPLARHPNAIIEEALRQIAGYFAGTRRVFDLPLDLSDQPAFRINALRACAAIPYGQVLTYAELAAKAGSPKGARAAGGAMAHNPIALIIPCHRVVGSDWGLHGFSSPGGLETKAILLRHEGLTVEQERVSKG